VDRGFLPGRVVGGAVGGTVGGGTTPRVVSESRCDDWSDLEPGGFCSFIAVMIAAPA
jgi:hypothetical protein